MTRLKQVFVGRNPARTAVRATVICLVCWVLFGFVARPVRFDGVSMEPTYRDGGFRLMSSVWLKAKGIRRGDVAAIRMPGGGAFYVKRVIGLPGEVVSFREGQLFINGSLVPEPYVGRPGLWELPATRVPPDHYFVAGDNRQTTLAGHTLGTVHQRYFAGIVFP